MLITLLFLLGGLVLCAGMALLTDSIAANLFRPELSDTGYSSSSFTSSARIDPQRSR